MTELETLQTKVRPGTDESDDERESTSAQSETSEDKRGTWGGQFEFVLSVVGYTVGLGNIWRFPYLCFRNGGGAFLIPFIVFLVLCGGPLYYIEVCLAQFSGKSPILVWEICPLFKGVGMLMVFVSFLYLWYFGVVFAWVLYFLVQSFYPTLGWASCQNDWNTKLCIDTIYSRTSVARTPLGPGKLVRDRGSSSNIDGNYSVYNSTDNVTATANLTYRTAGMEFWMFNVLRQSSGIDHPGTVQWHLLISLIVGWLLVFLCLIKGVKSVGKVVYVTATAPYLLLTILLIRGVTLDGALDGLRLYVTPKFELLASGQVWMEAAIQVFYSLGPAWGGVITMASFNKFHHKALRDTVIVCVADAFTAFYGGLVVFSVLGFLAKETNKPIEEFATSGPGLAFIAYPEALSRLPLPQLWSVLFFVTLVFIGIDTQFGGFETITNALIDKYPEKLYSRRTLLALVVAVLLTLCGIPLTMSGGYYIFLLADWYIATFNIVITALLEVVIVAWIYGAARFSKDIQMMTGSETSILVRLSWVIVIPAFMVTLTFMAMSQYAAPSYGKRGYVFPTFAIVIGNVFATAPLGVLVAVGVWEILKTRGNIFQRITHLLHPEPTWLPHDRKQREIYQLNPYVYEQGLLRRILYNVFGFNNMR